MSMLDTQWRRFGVVLFAFCTASLLSTCGESGTEPDPNPVPTPPGGIEVSLTVTGTSPDPNGCSIALDNGTASTIMTGATHTFSSVATGNHTVALAEIAENCTVSGDNPRTVSVASNQTATTTFEVTCPGYVSNFVQDAEGWTSLDNGDGLPVWEEVPACGGSAGGCLSITDAQGGANMAFRAPEHWRDGTDLSEYYGGQLSFTMKYEGTDNWIPTKGMYNVAIKSDTYGFVEMRFPDPYEKDYENAWQEIHVNLSTSVTPFPGGDLRNWFLNGLPFPAATEAQVRNILSSVDDILIRAEFDGGADKGYLDAVRFSATPDPDSLDILAKRRSRSDSLPY